MSRPVAAGRFSVRDLPVGANAGRARQRLGDEGLLSHPQCNSGIDYL